MVETGRANNAIRIPTSLQGKFFRIWIEYLTPLHNLTNREKDIVAAFIKARFELSKSVSDSDLLDRILMSDDIKNQIKDECGVSDAFFQVILGKLRKTGILRNGKINPKFIPKRLSEKDQSFQLLLHFDLDAANN
jgi:hypothetical protein